MRRFALCISVALIGAALVAPGLSTPALGAKAPLKCKTKTLEDKHFRLCTGLVPTEDGSAALDTDVTLPAKGDGPFPLIVMLHGLGGTKLSYEQTFDEDKEANDETEYTIAGTGGRYHYNNAWFASKGYAVLNYTARGFKGGECLDPSIPAADDNPDLYGESPACQPQIDHKDHEVKDAQHLIGRLVDGTLLSDDVSVDRRNVGATGVSYGGGPTWMLSRLNKWESPKGKTVKLAAVVPIIGWTDLLQALAPNGWPHAGMIPPTDIGERLAEPRGVPKLSYIDAFFTLLNITTQPTGSIPGYLDVWYERVHAGEPYGDDISQDFAESLLRNRSAYYIPQTAPRVPTLAVEGWTDHVFSAAQAVQMANRLKQEDPEYPIRILLNDFGHPIAGNPESDSTYQFDLIGRWFKAYLKDKGAPPAPVFESSKTICKDVDQEDLLYRADTFAGLQSGTADFDLDLAGPLSTATLDDHREDINPTRFTGPRNGCRVTDTLVTSGNLAATADVSEGLTMLGMPQVTLTADPAFADLYLAFRLWDVNGEEQTLVDRGVFRLGSDSPQTVVTLLQGNNYEFEAGHQLKLEITANDSPSYEVSNAIGAVDISNVSLSVPLANEAAIVP